MICTLVGNTGEYLSVSLYLSQWQISHKSRIYDRVQDGRPSLKYYSNENFDFTCSDCYCLSKRKRISPEYTRGPTNGSTRIHKILCQRTLNSQGAKFLIIDSAQLSSQKMFDFRNS